MARAEGCIQGGGRASAFVTTENYKTKPDNQRQADQTRRTKQPTPPVTKQADTRNPKQERPRSRELHRMPSSSPESVVVAAIYDPLERVVTGPDNEVKVVGECHIPCVPLRKRLRLRRQHPSSSTQPGRELTGPIEVLDTLSEPRHPLRKSGVPMAQDGGREEGDNGQDGADGRPDRAPHKVDVVAVAARKALVPVREAGPRRVAVVAGPGEEEVEEAAQGALEEEFVFGCEQPEGGEDEQEEVFEGEGFAPVEDEA